MYIILYIIDIQPVICVATSGAYAIQKSSQYFRVPLFDRIDEDNTCYDDMNIKY